MAVPLNVELPLRVDGEGGHRLIGLVPGCPEWMERERHREVCREIEKLVTDESEGNADPVG